MAPRKIARPRRIRFGIALSAALGAVASVQAFYLISPLSYWPASSVAGNTVFQVNLVAAPPAIPNPPLLDGNASWNAAFTEQMNAWNAILPDPVLVLQANTGSAAAPAQGDGKNDVVFANTIYGDTWGSSTLGICLSMWSANERTEADILFNATKTWNAYTGNLQGGTSDFRRVALHELGHALLLDHPDDVGQSVSAIMNSQSSNTDALATDDRAGVLAVFGGLTPVTITEQPRQLVTTSGGQFLLNVTAAGSEPVTYQWQRSTNGGTSWSNLSGFDFPNGSASGFSDGNLFRVVVTNPLGSVNSRPVLLTPTGGPIGPSFSVDPVSTTADQAGDAIFAVAAGGSRMPTYQWEYSSNGGGSWNPMFSSFGPTDVTGISGPTLKITNAISAMNGYRFRCVATNPSGSSTSAAAILTVNAGGSAPYFTWQPRDIFTSAGQATLVPAGVSGSPMPTIQWQISLNGGSSWSNLTNGGTFTGVSSETLSITSPDPGQNGALLRLNATNGSGSASSRAVMLSVQGAPAAPDVFAAPDPANVLPGGDAVFSARLSGLPAAVYQWEYSSDGVSFVPLGDGLFGLGTITLETIVSGANSRMLTLTNVDESLDQFRFRLLASNEVGTDLSAGAILTVSAGDTAPAITAHPQDATVTYTGDPTFTLAASGFPTPTIQWQLSTNGGGTWANVANDATFGGATSTTLTLTNPTVAMSGHRFRAVATNTVNSATSNAAILTVNPAATSVTLSNLSRSYTGALLAPTATTVPEGLSVSFTYNGSTTTPTNAGSYAVVATVTDPNHTGSASGTFEIAKAGASLQLTGLEQVYDGTPRSVTVATTPAGLASVVTYGGSATVPSAIATYVVAATINDANYTGSAGGTLSIIPGLTLGQAGTVTTTAGGATVLSVTANSGGGTTYRWQIELSGGAGWADVSGATGASFTIPSTQKFLAGNYRVVVTFNGVSATSAPVAVTVQDPPASNARLMNLSTRALSQTGDSILIPGFVVSGSGTKRLLIRGVGPTLGVLGVGGTLVDPQMRVVPYGSATALASNDDWGTNANKAQIITTAATVGAFALADGSKDAALLVDLAPGQYTVPTSGVSGGTGVAIVELYDADTGLPPTNLVNISNRGYVGVGDNVMIPGIVVSNEGSRTLLIRAVGPTLGAFGVAGVLEDPLLTVFSGQTPILTNDDWSTAPGAANTASTAAAVGAFALADGSKDAAFVVTLPPGPYTVQATGKNGSTGIALVEVYLVP